MAWYVYGVVDDGEGVPPDLVGIGQVPVEVLGRGDLRVVASAAPPSVRDLTRAPDDDIVMAVRGHDDVLLRVSRVRSVLPVRFGTVLLDEVAVDQLLEDADGSLRRGLAHVAGADEWVVTVTVAADDAPVTTDEQDLPPGHAFFARRRAEAERSHQARERAIAAAMDLDARLQALARDLRALDLRDPDAVARGAYLVPREHADRFVEHARAGSGAHVDVQGPLPPYRFAGSTS